jgi:hypothetical protein
MGAVEVRGFPPIRKGREWMGHPAFFCLQGKIFPPPQLSGEYGVYLEDWVRRGIQEESPPNKTVPRSPFLIFSISAGLHRPGR